MGVFFGASLAETLIVPIPIELILIPYMIANRARVWTVATVVLAGNLVAALVGYAIGYFAFSTFGRDLIDAMGWGEAFASFQTMFADNGFLAVLAIGIIPIPFQIAMLVAGAAHYPVMLFLLAAAIARGLRYYGIAALCWFLGDRATDLWDRHKTTVGLGLGALVLGYVVWTIAA